MTTSPQRVQRRGPLNRVQVERWYSQFWREREGRSAVLWDTWVLEEPCTPAALLAAVAEVCACHEVLRTRFGLSRSGLPEQWVFPPEDFAPPLEFRPAGGPWEEADPLTVDGTAPAAHPWRMVGRVHGDVVVAVDLRSLHIVTDASGLIAWRNQVFAALRGHSSPGRDRIVQPLDRASGPPEPEDPADISRSRVRAQAPVPVRARAGAGISGHLTTRPLVGAAAVARRVAREVSVSIASVVKFAAAWTVCRYTGRDSLCVSALVCRSAFGSDVIECRTHNVAADLNLAPGARPRDDLRHVHAATMSGYSAYEDGHGTPTFVDEAMSFHRRGIGGVAPLYYDFVAVEQHDGQDRPGDRAEGSTTSVGGVVDAFSPAVIVEEFRDDLRVSFQSHDALIDPGTAADLLVTVEDVIRHLGRSVDEPLPAALCPHRFDTDATVVAGRWLSTRGLVERLSASPGVVSASVRTQGGLVTATVIVDADTDVFDVHEATTEVLHHRRDLCAPDVYRWARSPGGPWSRWRPAVDPVPWIAPVGTVELALLRAVNEVTGSAVGNVALTCAQAGCDPRWAPAVAHRADRLGVPGLRREHFTAPLTMRSIARALSS